jgi:hypothetical protein
MSAMKIGKLPVRYILVRVREVKEFPENDAQNVIEQENLTIAKVV